VAGHWEVASVHFFGHPPIQPRAPTSLLPQIKIKTPAVVGFAAAMMAVIVVLVVIMTPVNKEIIRNNDDYSFQGEWDDIGACGGRAVVLPFKRLPFSPPSLLPAGATHAGLITHKYYCSAKNGKLDWVLYAYELVLLVAFIKVMASWHGGVGIRFNDAQTRSHPDTPPFPSLLPSLAPSLTPQIAYDVRSVPDAVKETNHIFKCMMLYTAVGGGAFAVLQVRLGRENRPPAFVRTPFATSSHVDALPCGRRAGPDPRPLHRGTARRGHK
jgi:hypothetical protein